MPSSTAKKSVPTSAPSLLLQQFAQFVADAPKGANKATTSGFKIDLDNLPLSVEQVWNFLNSGLRPSSLNLLVDDDKTVLHLPVEIVRSLTKLTLTLKPGSSFKAIQDLSILSQAAELVSLDLSDCVNLYDIGPLAWCTKLQHLVLRGCTRFDFFVISLPNLRVLDASNCSNLQGIPSLRDSVLLHDLNLSNCPLLRDVASLTQLTKLYRLDVSFTDSLTPQHLVTLSHILHLNVEGSRNIRDFAITLHERGKELPGLPHLNYFSTLPMSAYLSAKEKSDTKRAASPTKAEKATSPSKSARAVSPTKVEKATSPTKVEKATSPTKVEKAASPSKSARAVSPAKVEKATSPTRAASPVKVAKPASPSAKSEKTPLAVSPSARSDRAASPKQAVSPTKVKAVSPVKTVPVKKVPEDEEETEAQEEANSPSKEEEEQPEEEEEEEQAEEEEKSQKETSSSSKEEEEQPEEEEEETSVRASSEGARSQKKTNPPSREEEEEASVQASSGREENEGEDEGDE